MDSKEATIVHPGHFRKVKVNSVGQHENCTERSWPTDNGLLGTSYRRAKAAGGEDTSAMFW